MTDDMQRGFPRPWSAKYKVPTPYTAESAAEPGQSNADRIEECKFAQLCNVCGKPLDQTCSIALRCRPKWISEQTDRAITWSVNMLDSGASHRKCAKLADLFCPSFIKKPNLATTDDSGKHYFIHNVSVEKLYRWLVENDGLEIKEEYVLSWEVS